MLFFHIPGLTLAACLLQTAAEAWRSAGNALLRLNFWLQGGIAEESRASSKDVVDAKLDAALHLSLTAPELSASTLQSASPVKSASPER